MTCVIFPAVARVVHARMFEGVGGEATAGGGEATAGGGEAAGGGEVAGSGLAADGGGPGGASCTTNTSRLSKKQAAGESSFVT